MPLFRSTTTWYPTTPHVVRRTDVRRSVALGHGAGSRRRKERNVDELVSIEVGSCQVDHFGIIVDDRGKMEVLAIENMMIFKWSLKMLTGHNLEDATGIHWIGDH